MSKIILLDAGPLGLISNPRHSPQSNQCNQWVQEQLAQGVMVLIPEIADYEVRRELLRAKRIKGLRGWMD